jgi:protein SCO1/2
MKHGLRVILALSLFLGVATLPGWPARADHSPPPDVDPTGGQVAFDQKLDAQLPLDAVFHDEGGREVRLAEYFGQKPVVLLFAYYDCPMLCTLALNDLTEAMKGVPFALGEHFEVITVSIDPTEGPDLAAQKKAAYLTEYGRPGVEVGWHFLTGGQADIDRLAAAAGFKYYYDEQIQEYAHPTGAIVLTSQGRISRYLLGIDYQPLELRMALVEASARKIGKAVDGFYLLCYNYDPEHGGYTLAIQNFIRLAAVLFSAGLVLLIFTLVRSERRAGRPQAPDSRAGGVQHG